MKDEGLKQGRLFRDEALERVRANGKEEMIAATNEIVLGMPNGFEFTTDELWSRLPEDRFGIHEPRVIGAVVMQLAKAGTIVKTGRMVKLAMPSCHARDKPVWKRVR